MIYRVAIAILAGSLAAGAVSAQSTAPWGDRNRAETSCTTTVLRPGPRRGKDGQFHGGGKERGTARCRRRNSAAPTVQSGGKPMEVRKDCPPDSAK